MTTFFAGFLNGGTISVNTSIDAGMRRVRETGKMAEIAAALGITRQAPYLWDSVPVERVRVVAEITGIKPHELRPDIFPPPRRRRR